MKVIRVATLNVCGLPSPLRPLAERAPYFCRQLDESGLDVLAFQEVWSARALARLRTHLPSFPSVAWRRGLAGQPAGGLALFARRPLGAVSYHSFRGARPSAGSVRFRAKRAVNSMLQGVLAAELDGFVVANTHLTANKDGDWSAGSRYHDFQRAQLDRLHGVLRRYRATVVCGDFNIASGSPLYPLIVDGGAWQDPFAATDPVTYHTEFLPPGYPGHRIDYLLVRGGTATEPRVLFDQPDAGRFYLSDHVALTACVSSPGSPP
jgi:endonuclease/exonuclease/phosphatase family metal-dependent hydrolase